MIITIDGPAGSGKSTIAKKLAEKLNFYYLNTGLLYRAVAYVLTKILNKKEEELKNITEKDLDFISKISYEYENKSPQVFFDKKNITSFLYDSHLGQQASFLSEKKEVRGRLLILQKNVAKKYDIVAEGRDCGSVVFPNADYKFFLTASLEQRARRVLQDKSRGISDEDFKKVKEELEERDERDANRKISPLAIPKNAIIIDNSNLNQEETIKEFLKFIKEKE